MFGTLRTSAYWNPLRELDEFGDNLGSFLRILNDAQRQTEYPPVNTAKSDDTLLFCVELPGISPDDLEISVKNDTLILKGERKQTKLPENVTFQKQERGYGSFVRTFALPMKVAADSIDAVYADGILTIKAEKAPEEKARKIAVRQANQE